MIRISNAQVRTYQGKLDERLSKKILAFLKEECLASLDRFTDSMILSIINPGISRARSYQLTSEYAITAFIGLIVTIGFSFDKQPGIRKVLQMTDIEDNQRMDLLARVITESEWQEAIRMVDTA